MLPNLNNFSNPVTSLNKALPALENRLLGIQDRNLIPQHLNLLLIIIPMI